MSHAQQAGAATVKFRSRRDWSRLTLAVLAVWAAAVALAGASGAIAALPLPALAGLVVSGTAAPVFVYHRHSGFRTFMRSVPIEWLTGFHIWRIAAAALFFYYGSQDLLPPTFVRNAAWGDLIVGLAVPALLVLPRTAKGFLAFHVFGLADFIVAVGTGLIFAVLATPQMGSIATMPLVMIPLFGVCVPGASHIIAIDRLTLDVRTA